MTRKPMTRKLSGKCGFASLLDPRGHRTPPDGDRGALGRRTVIAALAVATLPAGILALAAPKTRVIRIVARKFEFVPGEIHVKRGETVTLQLTAPEVPMGFNLADFRLRTDVVPGRVASLQLTADRSGSFTFLCDVFCGSGHEDMSGTLVVG